MSATPEKRIEELGFTLPEVAPPVATYVPAVRTGSYVYTSGQLPLRGGELLHVGKVGAEVTPEQAYDCAQQCVLNALAAVRSVTGDLSAVTRVVKVVGFVASAEGFTAQPKVINGASDFLGQVFGDLGQHARSAVGMFVLPLDAPVELEVIVEVA